MGNVIAPDSIPTVSDAVEMWKKTNESVDRFQDKVIDKNFELLNSFKKYIDEDWFKEALKSIEELKKTIPNLPQEQQLNIIRTSKEFHDANLVLFKEVYDGHKEIMKTLSAINYARAKYSGMFTEAEKKLQAANDKDQLLLESEVSLE